MCPQIQTYLHVYRHKMCLQTLDMGWRRQVSFAEYSLFYRALLQKGPIILRSLRIVDIRYGVTNVDVSSDTDIFQCLQTNVDVGWLRSVGSIKLQVSFAEFSLSITYRHVSCLQTNVDVSSNDMSINIRQKICLQTYRYA